MPPSAPIKIYKLHTETVDELWPFSGCNMRIICGDLNLLNVNWLNSVLELSLSGIKNDEVMVIVDELCFLNFSQNIINQIVSLLDLDVIQE